MEPKKRGRPPKVDLPEIKPFNVSNDAFINVSLFMPGYREIPYTVRIRNLKGNISPSEMNPDAFIEVLKEALRNKFPGVI